MSKPPGVSGTIGNDADRCIPPAIRRLYKYQSFFFLSHNIKRLDRASLVHAKQNEYRKKNYLGFDAEGVPAIGCIN
jgi:hypothetical protein